MISLRGIYHLSLSLVIGLAIFFPLISLGTEGLLPTFLSLLFLLTILWGSLVPDVDTSGHSKIFYDYPTVAKFFKFGIYTPLAIILKEEKHRGFMHSLEGAILTVGLFLGYILIGLTGVGVVLIIYPPIIESLLTSFGNVERMVIDIYYILVALFIVGLGLFIGIILHLFEDSLTVSGIEWRWYGENKWYRKGNVRVGGIHETAVFGILFTEGGILVILQYSYNGDLVIQSILAMIGLTTIVGTWILAQTAIFGKLLTTLQGDDIKEIDAKSRERAKENQIKVTLEKGLTIVTDKNRIKRGLGISKHDVNLKTKTVDKYKIIVEEENKFTCSCKDFKNVGNLVVCKHVIAYLAKKNIDYQKRLEKKI
ncbi:MAG: hypothetical protein HeimC3_35730 [Candidatus Heimdallarchaeota archaeon LC_3]|nr:MAG: hypothetical protein HeimC3_35730 [Candidatus Heimdallarchaeota archaeon LC_3]